MQCVLKEYVKNQLRDCSKTEYFVMPETVEDIKLLTITDICV